MAPVYSAFASDDDLYFKWIENYDEAIRQAKETGKPIFLTYRCVP